MRAVAAGVAILWGLMALALTAHVSFVSLTANVAAVFVTVTASLLLMLTLARRIPQRALAVLTTVLLSGLYLAGLWFLGLGLVFYPWNEPDRQVRQDGRVCRAVYGDPYTEVRVSETYPLGIERLKGSYRIVGSPPEIPCPRDGVTRVESAATGQMNPPFDQTTHPSSKQTHKESP